MRIGIDVDNTITNTLDKLKKHSIKYNEEVIKRGLKINPKGYSTSTLFNWTTEENLIYCNKYLREIVLSAKIKDNAIEIINKLKDEGNKIYIITARRTPTFIDPYSTTKEQIEKYGIKYDEIVANCVDKYKYCKEKNIDIMIDDEPKNVNDISKYIPVIAFKYLHNEECKGKNIIKVNTWNEVYEEYQKIKNTGGRK